MRRRKVSILLSDLTSVEIKYDNSSLCTHCEEDNNKKDNNYRIIREHKLKYDAQIEEILEGYFKNKHRL